MNTQIQTVPHEEAKPHQWGGLNVILYAVVSYVVALFVSSFLLGLYAHYQHWPATRTNEWLHSSITAQFSYVLINDIIMGLLLFGFVKVGHYKNVLKTIGLVWPKARHFAMTLAAAAVYYALYFVVMLVVIRFIGINDNQTQDVGFQTLLTRSDFRYAFLSLVILPPIIEEILFRGFIFAGLRKSMKFVGAAIITSAIFAVPHLLESSDQGLLWSAGVDTFILSLVLCYLREKTGNLWAGMGLHAIKNAVAFYVLFIAV